MAKHDFVAPHQTSKKNATLHNNMTASELNLTKCDNTIVYKSQINATVILWRKKKSREVGKGGDSCWTMREGEGHPKEGKTD